MPDNPPADETPKPKSSADLIREAREASAGTRGPDSGASDALIQESHTWMEDRTPIADMAQADGPTATDESDLFEDADLVFGAPAPRPAPASRSGDVGNV